MFSIVKQKVSAYKNKEFTTLKQKVRYSKTKSSDVEKNYRTGEIPPVYCTKKRHYQCKNA